MLIDCGIHSSVPNGTQTIRDIVDNILTLTKRLDVIVLTHEHWDHNSGFFSALDKFKQFEVGEIWLGWTENAADPQAREQLVKLTGQMSIPVIVVDDQVVQGFDKAKLKSLLGI